MYPEFYSFPYAIGSGRIVYTARNTSHKIRRIYRRITTILQKLPILDHFPNVRQ